MTVVNTDFYNEYAGDGVTTTFPFTWRITEPQMLVVQVNGVTKTLGVDYAVTLNIGTTGYGGSVIFTSAPTLIPATDIVILQASDLLQNNNLANNKAMPPSTIMAMIDKLTILIQAIRRSALTISFTAAKFNGAMSAPPPGGIPVINAAGTGAQWIVPVASGYPLIDGGPGQPAAFGPLTSALGGNVVGAVSSTQHSLALFADATGKTLEDGGSLGTAGQVWTSNGPGVKGSMQNAPAALPNTIQFGGPTAGGLRGLLNIPTGLAVVAQGTPGATAWGYAICAVDATGTDITAATATVSIANGNATLDVTNKNHLSWNAQAGATKYKIYRITAGGTPNTLGLIATTGNVTSYDDTGSAGDTTSAPSSSTFTGEHWHHGDFTTDAPISATRLRLHLSGTLLTQAGHHITVASEMPGGIVAKAQNVPSGPGSGLSPGYPGYSAGSTPPGGGGGGHGGAGGTGAGYFADDGGIGGQAYGIEHMMPGSGGGAGAFWTSGGGAGGRGGGAILIEAAGDIILHGNILAVGGNGGAGVGQSDGGGGAGAGGGIYCVAQGDFINFAAMRAYGGTGGDGGTVQSAAGAGGGGGHIFVRAGGGMTRGTADVGGGVAGNSVSAVTAATNGAAGVQDCVGNVLYSVRTAP